MKWDICSFTTVPLNFDTTIRCSPIRLATFLMKACLSALLLVSKDSIVIFLNFNSFSMLSKRSLFAWSGEKKNSFTRRLKPTPIKYFCFSFSMIFIFSLDILTEFHLFVYPSNRVYRKQI